MVPEWKLTEFSGAMCLADGYTLRLGRFYPHIIQSWEGEGKEKGKVDHRMLLPRPTQFLARYPHS